MLTWDLVRHRVSGTHYRASIGRGDLALYAFIQDNGEGFFNWCISPSANDSMMEHPLRLPGGSDSLEQAKADVQREAEQVVEGMARSLGLAFGKDAQVKTIEGLLTKLCDAAGVAPEDRHHFGVERISTWMHDASTAFRHAREVHAQLHAAHEQISQLEGEVRTLRTLYGKDPP